MIAMYTLYYAPGSANMLVHLTLLEGGAPYRLELMDLDAGQPRLRQAEGPIEWA
jgi:glutathione S-transferase